MKKDKIVLTDEEIEAKIKDIMNIKHDKCKIVKERKGVPIPVAVSLSIGTGCSIFADCS